MRLSFAWTVLLLVGCTGSDNIIEVPPPPPPTHPFSLRLEIYPFGSGTLALPLGNAILLAPRITVIGHPGEVLTPSGTISYSSRVPGIVSVDGAGRVSGLAEGRSTIDASTTVDGQLLTDTLAVTVGGVLCTTELKLQWSPADSSIAVGARFTPVLSLTTCGGRTTLAETFSWSAADPAVVSVDPNTGEIVGVRAGTTTVHASGQVYHVGALISVTVH